ncbi:hypothetical protein RDABS01_003984, partial [Bienertia sinuspersici]
MANFREVINTCELRDLGYEGQWWTWERGNTVSTRVRERLDHFVASSSWCQIYPRVWVEHLLRYKSDHSPIVLRFTKKGTKKHKRGKIFKFEAAWLLDDSCEATVKKAWEAASSVDMVEKLALVGNTFVQWSGEKFDDLGKQIKETKKALKLAQSRDITQESCEEGLKLEKVLDDLHRKHEAYWYLSLLFARANRQECKVIVDTLNKYEVASGQKINYQKSEVSFSRGIRIPTIAGRSKKAFFDAVQDRIENWKKADPKLKQKAAFLAWIIWSERNAKVFNRKVNPHAILVARLKRMVEEYVEHNNKIYGAAIVREPQRSLGVVARGNDGSVLFTATRR